ncbi:MAG TPA: sulfotransferase [Fontimonas sp.]
MTTDTPRAAAPIAILGMHRSGTSCLAGCLQEAGLYLGDVNTAAPANARGNRENRAIMDLHDMVLRDNGGSWDMPPAAPKWSAEQRQQREALIGGFPRHEVWGFKDPRSLLVLDGWRESLPALRFIGTFRHPAAVAASLRTRNGFTMERGYEIWREYNTRLLRYQRELGFALLSFDWEPERYRLALEANAARLGLKAPQNGFEFFAGSLRSHRASAADGLGAKDIALYAQLQEIAE